MKKQHDFDEPIVRRGTDARKYAPSECPNDVVPMWIADSDFASPKELVDALLERVKQGHYGYPFNDIEFCNAVSKWQTERFNWDCTPEMVEFAPGAVLPLVYGMRAFSSPGDKVVLQTPAYHPLFQLIENNGRRIARNPLILKDGRYEIDFENLEKKLSDTRAKVMILCNPQNPTGRVFTRNELQKIGDLCLKHHVFVLSDEIHSDIVYSGHKHIPFAAVDPRFRDICCISINPSKTFNTAGLRTAAFICPNQHNKAVILEERLNNKAFGRPIFGQLAMKVLYNECAYYADQFVEYVEENVKMFHEGLKNIKGMHLIYPEGTYLLWVDCREWGMAHEELMRFFKETVKVLPNDGSTFGHEGEGFARFNVACPRSTVLEAVKRIQKAVNA